MIRTQLDDTTREELQDLRQTDLPAKVRDRLEAVLLSDAGWSPPRIAAYLGWHPHTARSVLKDFRRRGQPALWPSRPGPPPDRPRQQRVVQALERLLAQDLTWNSGQLSEALHADGIAIGPRQLRRYLKRMNAGYRRTASSLAHKQDPAKVARAEVVLENLKAKAAAGELRLCYLDECGFSPSLPISYSWSLPGQRKRVPYEYPQGRRVNALAIYEPYGSEPGLNAEAFERTLKSEDLLAYLGALPSSRGTAGGGAGQRQPSHQQGGQGAAAGTGPLAGCTCTTCRRTARSSTRSRRTKQTPPQATGGARPPAPVIIDVAALLELAAWCRQHLIESPGETPCPTTVRRIAPPRP